MQRINPAFVSGFIVLIPIKKSSLCPFWKTIHADLISGLMSPVILSLSRPVCIITEMCRTKLKSNMVHIQSHDGALLPLLHQHLVRCCLCQGQGDWLHPCRTCTPPGLRGERGRLWLTFYLHPRTETRSKHSPAARGCSPSRRRLMCLCALRWTLHVFISIWDFGIGAGETFWLWEEEVGSFHPASDFLFLYFLAECCLIHVKETFPSTNTDSAMKSSLILLKFGLIPADCCWISLLLESLTRLLVCKSKL